MIKPPTPTLLLFLLLFISFHAWTQVNLKPGEISGKIIDQDSAEIMYASVALLHTDSSIIKGVISNPTGDFTIEHLDYGTYLLKVEHLEYVVYFSIPISISQETPRKVHNITLTPFINELGEVVVRFRKPLIEVKADKLVYNVSTSPSASGTDGLELLKKAPGVTLDMDNNISLLGKTGVQVFINGIETRLSGSDLVTFLQSISSDNVESIDIIANPPAKYEAEGTGGIIDIKMKKNRAQGFNGNVSSSFTKGKFTRYNNSLSLNYGSEKIRVNTQITQSGSKSFDNFLDTKIQNNAILDLDSEHIRNRKGLNVALGLEATLSKDQMLSFSGRSVINQKDQVLESQTDIYSNAPVELSEILLSNSMTDIPSTNHTLNLNHQWQLNASSHLTTAASFGRFSSDKSTLQPNTLLQSDGETVLMSDDSKFDAFTDIDLWSAKSDFEKTWDQLSLSTGLKYSSIKTDNGFDFYNIITDQPEYDPTKSNDFIYRENVTALYGIMNLKLTSALILNAGLRMEHTSSRGQLFSETVVNNKDVKRNYTNFFPNFSLSFNNQKDHAISFNLGRRITRPNYQNLNPFETPISQLTIWKGNPFLRPRYTMNYQLYYAFRQKLIITNTYSVTTDFFASIFEIIGENSNQIIPRNMQQSTNYAVSVSYPLDLTKFWSFTTFLQGSHSTYEGNLEGTVIDLNVTNYSLRMQHNIKLPFDIKLDISYFMENDWIWRGSINVKGNQNLSFGLRKYFFDKKLQISITGSDILRTTNDYFYKGAYGGIDIDGVRSFDSQRFGLGVTWKFGNQKVKTKGKTKGALDEELNRIDN